MLTKAGKRPEKVGGESKNEDTRPEEIVADAICQHLNMSNFKFKPLASQNSQKKTNQPTNIDIQIHILLQPTNKLTQ